MNDKTPYFARRDFLKASSLALGATALGFPTFIPASAFGASQRLILGHIGVGGMGGFHLNRMVALMEQGQTNVAAVCDVDEKRLIAAQKKAGENSKAYRDYRHVLERKDLDAVVSPVNRVYIAGRIDADTMSDFAVSAETAAARLIATPALWQSPVMALLYGASGGLLDIESFRPLSVVPPKDWFVVGSLAGYALGRLATGPRPAETESDGTWWLSGMAKH